MKSKGISPLIAAVLLIAFTMAVASLFAQWAPQLIKSAQGDTKNKSDEIQKCSAQTVDILDADEDNATVQQTTGDSAIGNVSVTWYFDSKDPIQQYTDINSNRKVKSINNTLDASGSLSELRITPVDCEGAGVSTYEP